MPKTPKFLMSTQEAVQRGLVTLYNIQLIAPSNPTVAQNEFGASIALNLGSSQKSGKILSVDGKSFTSLSTIKVPALDLLFFNENPSITVAQAGLSTTNARRYVGAAQVASGDWFTAFATSAISHTSSSMPFTTTLAGTLYMAGVNRGTIAFNSAPASNDEILISFHFEMRTR